MPRSILRDVLTSLPQAALLTLLLILAGCGNKGPLYLPSSPEPQSAVSTAPAQAAALPETPDSQ